MALAEALKMGHQANTLLNNGAFAEAEPLLRMQVDRTSEQNNGEWGLWMRRLAEALIGQGKWVEAETVSGKAFRFWERKYGAGDEDTLDCGSLQLACMLQQKRYLEGASMGEELLRALEDNLKRGPEHVTTLKCKVLFAKVLRSTDFEKSAELANSAFDAVEALEIRSETNAAAGGRRLTERDRIAISEIKELLSEFVNVRRNPGKLDEKASLETMSTEVPE
mmetsp:Transcript_12064/g.21420  ORF Transcript_12064/g.21420 Transcript_12064/m.21420 type:complete len:222 (+) Transcript_12064:52-717(+)|eukprot:CAMPEP_0197627618 /NCGR_PEP_ID=MMETSP1338-20131121/6182_1 /TAXON_ID=43686 ORGANISM="Pelagodinium beii, Strain RCC1491" /NCGR_SAMPLE_ID=MMETSP1338 /ASSEMBLY_ACC=CAM_ASM_000754 /LENGTH=221 /DNA_ID=CAMNT_0043198379 /DNA_START=51 /DNA_END=716 /DNA_ORIENTATION=-